MSQASEHARKCSTTKERHLYLEAIQDAIFDSVEKEYRHPSGCRSVKLLSGLIYGDGSKMKMTHHQNGEFNQFYALED